MNKMIAAFFLCSIVLFGRTSCSAEMKIAVSVENIFFTVGEESGNVESKVLNIEGKLSDAIVEPVTCFVQNESGEAVDARQTKSDENGKFSIRCVFTKQNAEGNYKVSVSAADADNICYKTIHYDGIKSDAELSYFELEGVKGQIDGSDIHLSFPSGTDLRQAAALFNASPGTLVYVNDVLQESGSSKNNFSGKVIYKVVSEDRITVRYYTVNAVVKTKTSGSGGYGGGEYIGAKNANTSCFMSNSAVTATESTDNEKPLFSDIDGRHWAYPYVKLLYDKGIISGDEQNYFHPEDNITREEFVKTAVVAFGLSGSCDLTGRFFDIQNDAWYSPYVAAGVSNGMIQGVSGNRFGIGEYISREDMAVMIYRCMKGVQKGTETFLFDDDTEISEYAKEAVYSLRESGIISGTEDNCFRPKAWSTRSEAAKIIGMKVK